MSKIQYNTIDEVLRRLATGRSTLYTKVQQGVFPKPVKLGKRKIAWPQHEVDQMMIFYLRSPSEEQAQDFVRDLESDRLLERQINAL